MSSSIIQPAASQEKGIVRIVNFEDPNFTEVDEPQGSSVLSILSVFACLVQPNFDL